jgi:hypothetical protein
MHTQVVLHDGRDGPTPMKAANHTSVGTTERNNQNSNLERITRAPDTALEKAARTYHVHSHMFATEELSASIHNWLETNIMLQQDASTESLLGSVVSAVSLANFCRTKTSTEALVLGSRMYIQALSRTKSAVDNANETTTDHFLLTVKMLDFYEHAVSNYNTKYYLAESFHT